MKHLQMFESFDDRLMTRRQRIFQREKENWEKLPEKEKKKYDAKTYIRLLKKNFPDEKFEITSYYDTNAKCVFLSDKSRLLNVWARGRDRGDNDGLNDMLADFLRKNNLEWSWRHKYKNSFSWDGIQIKPTDFRNFEFYYNIAKEPKVNVYNKDHKTLNQIIQLFKNHNLIVEEPENGIEYNGESDRYSFDTEIKGMNFRFELIRPGPGPFKEQGSYNQQIIIKLHKTKESLKRHFKEIKEVYDYCKNIADGPLWTFSGGGGQLQQFYGDDNGYLATLYLDMENPAENKQWGKNPEERTLVVNGSKNDSKFANFKSDSIEFVSHKSVFGDKY